MNLEEQVEITILSKYYGKLLTDRQQNILNMYVDNNLSLAEISEELNISRQAVKDAVDNAIQTLKQTEERLQFISRDARIKEIINKSTDIKTKIELISFLEE